MDIRPPNLLWSQEAQRVMLIDFERAVTAKQCHHCGASSRNPSSSTRPAIEFLTSPTFHRDLIASSSSSTASSAAADAIVNSLQEAVASRRRGNL